MSEITSTQSDESLKDNLNQLIDSTPPEMECLKGRINKKVTDLVESFGDPPKSPFKNKKEELDVLTNLIQDIACVEFSQTELRNFKTIFKDVFKYNNGDFKTVYEEKRCVYLAGRKRKKMEVEENEKARRLSSKKTDLLEIHAKLTDVSSASHDIIEFVIAVAISLKVSLKYGLSLLWLLLVGPPSSDKTGSVTTIRDVPFVFHLDTLTENSFISGFVFEDGSVVKDLLAELDKKCFVVKDYTTLFSLKSDTIKKILGDMCAIYDKSFSKFMGTRGRVHYESVFSHLGCITPVALASHQIYMNMIGARFLFYRILPLTTSQLTEGYEIAWSGCERNDNLKQLKDCVSAYVWQLQENIPDLKPETAQQKITLNNLAELLRHGRAVIRTERRTGENTDGKKFSYYEVAETQVEEPWRALQQIQVLTRSLAIAHKRNCLTDHEIELARRVVMSSMPVDRAEVLCLFQHEEVRKQGYKLGRKLCAQFIGKDYNQALRILTELKSIGLLDEVKEGKEWVYHPKAEFKELVIKPMDHLDHVADLMDVTQNFP